MKLNHGLVDVAVNWAGGLFCVDSRVGCGPMCLHMIPQDSVTTTPNVGSQGSHHHACRSTKPTDNRTKRTDTRTLHSRPVLAGLHHAKKSEASGFCYVNDIVLVQHRSMQIIFVWLLLSVEGGWGRVATQGQAEQSNTTHMRRGSKWVVFIFMYDAK